MKSKYLMCVFLLIYLIFPSSAWPEQQNNDSKENAPDKNQLLTYDKYILRLKEKLPELKKNLLNVERAKNKVSGSGAQEDFNLNASFKYLREKPYSLLPNQQLDRMSGYSTGIGLNKKIIETGTALSSGLNYSATGVMSSAQSLDVTYHSPSFYFGFTQPVMKNIFGKTDRWLKKDAKMRYEIEKVQSDENEKVILNYYRKLYFSWIEAYERVTLLQTSIENAQKQYDYAKRKASKGLVENDDVQLALATLLQYRQTHRETKASLEAITKELALYFDTDEINPDRTELTMFFHAAISSEYACKAFKGTRLSGILVKTKKTYEYEKNIKTNELLPSLDLEGNIEVNSRELTFGDSFSNMDNVDYSLGLLFTYPLGNRAAKSDIKYTDITLKEIERDIEMSENSYEKNLRKIVADINGYKEIYDLKQRSLDALRSRFATQQDKYKKARLDLYYLIDTSNKILSEEIGIISLKNLLISLYIDYNDLTT